MRGKEQGAKVEKRISKILFLVLVREEVSLSLSLSQGKALVLLRETKIERKGGEEGYLQSFVSILTLLHSNNWLALIVNLLVLQDPDLGKSPELF